MNLHELEIKVRKEFDRRNLKSNVRYRYLDQIVSYIRDYHNGNILVLEKPKTEFKSLYKKYKESIGKAFSQAENSAINEIYNQLGSISGTTQYTTPIEKKVKVKEIEMEKTVVIDNDFSTLLDPNNFELVSKLNESLIPNSPGLYAIRIKDISALPHPFSDELHKRGHNLLYFGKATKSLRNRLWHQELNHKEPATFFRSIGAILGYTPKKGSLYGNKTINYKFEKEDTDRIRKWIKENLLINIQIAENNFENIETQLILEGHPIINIKKNPYKMPIISKLRNECVRIAKEV